MDQTTIDRQKKEQRILWEKWQEYERLAAEARGRYYAYRIVCDHTNPDGTSALTYTGMGWDTCTICGDTL